MNTISISNIRKNIYNIIKNVTNSHKPLLITGKSGNVVMVSEEDWNSVQETLYLLSIPGMRKEIRKGLETPVEECSEELNW
ncbi:MAG: type II toxin-antitoxin system Phd/YefM family antitoxin [Acidobacteriota bacterium]